MKLTSKLLAPLLASLLFTGEASAWEATSTHAGLTEASAFSSSLHAFLTKQFGHEKGLYSRLTIPRADAPALFAVLAKLNPTHGYSPNVRGQMSALAWLVAGSVIADMPASQSSNHFFDPRSSKGLSQRGQGLKQSIYISAMSLGSPSRLGTGGQAANTWWASADNPMGYVGFAGQFRLAVSASSAEARSRHLAGSLLAAGSMLHVLQDMGSPSHVRNDLAAHQEQVSLSANDLGSRFERVAALAFGRLGVSRTTKAPSLTSLADHFSNAAGTGLADYTEANYFSNHTLPKQFTVRRDAGSTTFRERIESHLSRPKPEAPSHLDLIAARNPDGATWSNSAGVCLTRYRHKQSKLSFWIDDDCALEQLEAILPVVSGYGASFLEALYPSDLSVELKSGKLQVSGPSTHYAKGELRFFSESSNGTRTEFHKVARGGNSDALGQAPTPPPNARAISVLFDGMDNAGKPLLATTRMSWPPQK